MARPVAIDLTYVAARLRAPAPSGIERVDAAYARHFTAQEGSTPAVHYGLRRPHLRAPAHARALVAEAAQGWRAVDPVAIDPVEQALLAWLAAPPRPAGPLRRSAGHATTDVMRRSLARLRWRLAHDRDAVLPRGALYLNVAQYAFEYPLVFRWLSDRPDITPVFFVHDMLPLERPEFFRAGYEALFARRVATMARFAGAAIVSSAVVAERVAAEMRRRGRPELPILSAPLPPPAHGEAALSPDATLAPYLVMVGTIEARKNHLGLLQSWQRLVEDGAAVPRLVLVGARGWENEQAVDLLERCRAIAPHVIEVSGLGTPALHRLIGGARALLMPSFAEGYGLPIAEALAAGTPVIASDIPVFREVSQGCATLLDPTDGPAWRRALMALVDAESGAARQARVAAARYAAPRWPAYFATVERFLASL